MTIPSEAPDVQVVDADRRDVLAKALDTPPVLTGLLYTVQNFLSNVCLFIASIAMVVLVAIFSWLVFGRYVLNDTPTWVEQLSLLLVILITFLGSAALVNEDKHLGVTFIRDSLPLKLRVAVRLAGDLMLAAFGVTMAIYCSELVAFSWGNQLPMLGIPEGIRSLPAAICGGLIALFSGLRSVNGFIVLFSRSTNKLNN